MSDWISVKDRLPDTIGSYIVYSKKETITAWAFFNSNKNWAVGDGFMETVAYWMPLPEPPEDSK